MAAAFSCDGCSTSIQNPVVVGRVLKRDYCEDCAAKARAYIDAEEEMRKRLVVSFEEDRGLLIAAASEGGFRLPDVPEVADGK